MRTGRASSTRRRGSLRRCGSSSCRRRTSRRAAEDGRGRGAPWRDRCEKLEAQVESERGMRLLRRESEAQRTALEATAASSSPRSSTRRRGTWWSRPSCAQLEALHDVSSGQIRGEPTDEVTGRRTARENTELTARNERLLEEIDELRREADGLRAVREQLLQAQAATPRIRRPIVSAARQRVARAEGVAPAERTRRGDGGARSAAGAAGSTEARCCAAGSTRSTRRRPRRAAKTKVAEVQRDVERLKVEMEQRAMEAARRDRAQASRDELAEHSPRRSATRWRRRRARDEEGGKVKTRRAPAPPRSSRRGRPPPPPPRARPPRGRSASARRWPSCTAPDRRLLEEAERLRRRGAAERLSVTSELHALRLERSGVTVALKRLEEGEAAHVAARADAGPAALGGARGEGGEVEGGRRRLRAASKLHRTRKQWGREGGDAPRRGQGSAPRRLARRENRNRAEGEKLRAERDAARRGATLVLSAAGGSPPTCRL